MRRIPIAVAVLVGLISPLTGNAHHSIAAMYARESGITLQGKITRLEYINPHAVIHLEATSATGQKETWVIEWSSRTRLDARGYTAETLRAGDNVVISGGPARDGSKRLFVSKLVRPADGFEYVSRQAT
jgi:Family of unknown function (DUF6152)